MPRQRKLSLLLYAMSAAGVVSVAVTSFGSAQTTAGAGQQLFEKRCGGCHAIDREKEGPHLSGVYGRTAGSVASFQYSDVLKNSGITWDARTLDQWLTDPEKLVPGNDMAFHLDKPEERREIIAYLKQKSTT